MKNSKQKNIILFIAVTLIFSLLICSLSSCTKDKADSDGLTETDGEFDEDGDEDEDEDGGDDEEDAGDGGGDIDEVPETTEISEETTGEEIVQYEKLIEQGVVYKSVANANLKLDIYYPTNRIYSKNPTIVAFHGGGWVSGERSEMIMAYAPFLSSLRANGYAVVTVQYRFVSQASYFPNNLEDCIDAIKFLIVNGEEYDIDENEIGVMGYSAGAHLAMMSAYAAEKFVSLDVEMPPEPTTEPLPEPTTGAGTGTPEPTLDLIGPTRDMPADASEPATQEEPVVEPPTKRVNIKYCISFAGPTKLYDDDINLYPQSILYMVDVLFGGSYEEVPDAYKAGSPYYYISDVAETNKTPLMLVHGDNDTVVPHVKSQIMYEKALEVGIACEFITLRGVGHTINFNYENMTAGEITVPEGTEGSEETGGITVLSRDEVVSLLERFVYSNTNKSE